MACRIARQSFLLHLSSIQLQWSIDHVINLEQENEEGLLTMTTCINTNKDQFVVAGLAHNWNTKNMHALRLECRMFLRFVFKSLGHAQVLFGDTHPKWLK